ncbi:MAG: AAA family ATPase [Planctomycetota bacterium]
MPHAPFFLSEPDAPAIEIRDAAHAYLGSGLCPLPAIHNGSSKRPAVDWKRYQSQRPTFVELEGLFHERGNALCLVCGAASHHLEVIDFDLGGAAFDAWQEAVEAEAGSLLDRVVVETTPSGGRHVLYRCMAPVSGNLKLAQRRLEDGSTATVIETRGEGGVCLVDPSPGYRIVQGDLTDVTILTPRERDVLLRCAAELNEVEAKPTAPPVTHDPTTAERPGDIFNREGDVRDVLDRHGWRLDRGGENEHWTRPGKGGGTSATLKDRVFYVFSSNAAPFEPGTPYGPFAVYALLEHGGDFAAAARALGGEHSPARPPAHMQAVAGPVPEPAFCWAGSLSRDFPRLRTPLIDGLLREGETMNIIAAPKTGKSWLTIDLALAVATGGWWLGAYRAERSPVLILDNELHAETSAHRIPQVAEARGLKRRDYADSVAVDNLRGRLTDIHSLGGYFESIRGDGFKLIILDAFYRFLPRDTEENDNAAMAGIYNTLDRYAHELGCCFVLVHHASKGAQANKSVTDVGAGAGSQSRATDTHLVLRPHEEDGCVVLDAAVRSWPPIEPLGLRWDFPIWTLDETLDPSRLQRSSRRSSRRGDENEEKPAARIWTPAEFTEQFLTDTPMLRDQVLLAAERGGLSKSKAESLLKVAIEEQLVERRVDGPSAPHRFARMRHQPLLGSTG